MASPQAKRSPRTPVNNRATAVHLRLRSKIVSGHFPQGSALAEPVLAEHFHTSRAPIREALIALEREGLVQFEKTGRTRVRSFSGSELKEIMEARAAIEGMAARLANPLWTKEDTAALEKNIAAQERARDLAELSRLDIDLHHHVVTRSGNASLVRLWEPLRWQWEVHLAEIYRRQKSDDFIPEKETIKAHQHLLKALAEGTPAEASEAMMHHILFNLRWAK
jgi:DNA-binding GntR family transcriptional regulator